MSKPQKSIPSKYFYDERGSELFEAITKVEEYYLTGAERSILHDCAGEMARHIGSRSVLIELGSGSGRKTRLLLDRLPDLTAYVPVDISGEYLRRVSQTLKEDYPELPVRPVCADYTGPFDLPDFPEPRPRHAIFFPGSTIGNFSPPQARLLLSRIAGLLRTGDVMLVGVDLKKDPAIIEAAYNDREGVTAAFNRNILRHINRRLEADFDPSLFDHRAFYDEEKGRVEMHLVSRTDHEVTVSGVRFPMEEGETIHTENSCKYSPEEFRELTGSDFEVEKAWTDERDWFSVQLLIRR